MCAGGGVIVRPSQLTSHKEKGTALLVRLQPVGARLFVNDCVTTGQSQLQWLPASRKCECLALSTTHLALIRWDPRLPFAESLPCALQPILPQSLCQRKRRLHFKHSMSGTEMQFACDWITETLFVCGVW